MTSFIKMIFDYCGFSPDIRTKKIVPKIFGSNTTFEGKIDEVWTIFHVPNSKIVKMIA